MICRLVPADRAAHLPLARRTPHPWTCPPTCAAVPPASGRYPQSGSTPPKLPSAPHSLRPSSPAPPPIQAHKVPVHRSVSLVSLCLSGGKLLTGSPQSCVSVPKPVHTMFSLITNDLVASPSQPHRKLRTEAQCRQYAVQSRPEPTEPAQRARSLPPGKPVLPKTPSATA